MTQTPATVPALDRFFATLRRSPVVRPPGGRVGGVCAGVAQRLGLSVTMVRVAAVVLAILGPAGGLYLLAWLLLPDGTSSIRLERALRQGEGSSIALLVVTVLALVSDLGVHSRAGWLSLVLVTVIAWGFYRAGSRPAATPDDTTPHDPAPPVTPR